MKGRNMDELNIINLTPHEITILNEFKTVVMVVPPSGRIARLDSDKELLNSQKSGIFQHPIPFFVSKYGIPICLKDGEQVAFPEEQTGIIYIVSGIFRASYKRNDLWQPGELVRNEDGQPIGCIGLSQ